MKCKGYSEEQIIGVLKEHEARMPAQDVIRKHDIAIGTFYRWKSKFSGMEVSDAKRLREPEAENARLKRLLADTMLEKTALEDVRQEKWGGRRGSERLSSICSRPTLGVSGGRANLPSSAARRPHTNRRENLVRPRVPMNVPTEVNERGSLGFVLEQLADGRRTRILNIVEDFSRKCVGQRVDTSISGVHLVRYLDDLALSRPRPKTIVMDNDPKLTSKAVFFWSQKTGVNLCFIQPGNRTQNSLVECFHASEMAV